MCELVEEYARELVEEEVVKSTIEEYIYFNLPKEKIIARLMEKYTYSLEQAEQVYSKYSK